MTMTLRQSRAAEGRARQHAVRRGTSLGVVLYELLTGHRPHAAGTAFDLARAVCEDDPLPPSAVDTATGPARRLDAELDAIVLMALRKEAGRRYATVEALSEDLRRYLAGLPVLARPDAVSYRARKFVERHRAGVALTAAALVLLAAFAVGTAWQAQIARAAQARAEREAAEAVLQSRRAEEQSRIAGRYRQDAEREAAAARQQAAIADQQRAEAERRTQEAAVERERADEVYARMYG